MSERTVTRRELQQALTRLGLHEPQAAEVIRWLWEELAAALGRGEKVVVTGFGTFRVTQRRARRAHNPKTGAAVAVPAKRVVGFTVSREYKRTLNPEGSDGQ